MRVLVATTAGAGHFAPLVPFARACVESGHEVRVAAPASFAGAVGQAGFVHAPLADASPAALGAAFARIPELTMQRANELVIREVFGGLDAEAALPGLRSLVEEWRPDVLLREPAEVASYAVAQEAGLPYVDVNIGLDDFADELVGLLDEPLKALGCGRGTAAMRRGAPVDPAAAVVRPRRHRDGVRTGEVPRPASGDQDRRGAAGVVGRPRRPDRLRHVRQRRGRPRAVPPVLRRGAGVARRRADPRADDAGGGRRPRCPRAPARQRARGTVVAAGPGDAARGRGRRARRLRHHDDRPGGRCAPGGGAAVLRRPVRERDAGGRGTGRSGAGGGGSRGPACRLDGPRGPGGARPARRRRAAGRARRRAARRRARRGRRDRGASRRSRVRVRLEEIASARTSDGSSPASPA